jgi:hypothetical protein
MAAEDKYFQFPLIGLAYGKNFIERLDTLISYSLVRVGRSVWNELDEEAQEQRISEFDNKRTRPADFRKRKKDYPILLGAQIVGAALWSIARTVENHDAFESFRRAFEAGFGCDAEVRIRTDLMFEARNGRFKYVHFAVLAAAYSVLGTKKFAPITRSMIQRRAAGYKSIKVSEGMRANREDGATPLTTKQIRTALDTLEKKGFLVRVNPNRRMTYFSSRLSRAQLAEEVAKVQVAKQTRFLKEKREANEALRLVIERQKQALLSNIEDDSPPPF